MNDYHLTQKSPSTTHPRKNDFFLSLALILALIASLVLPAFQPPAYAVDAPVLLTPADMETMTAKAEAFGEAHPPVALPTFTWQAIDGATKYRIQIAQDIAFTNIKADVTTPLTRYIPNSVTTFNDGTWYWRVRVESPQVGSYSEIWTFTKQWASINNFPDLISPTNGATLQFLDPPIFSWQPMIGAASYNFQIATSPAFTTLIVNITTLTTTYQPFDRPDNGTYYWRVIPLDPAGREGTYSENRSFVMAYNQIPQLLEPANGLTPTFTPTFRWTAVRGAQYYRLQYSTDPTFVAGTISLDTRNTTYTPLDSLENDKNYYWRVRAHTSGLSFSDWTPVWNFLKKWYILPVLLTPPNGYQHVRFPTFTWSPVPGAAYYHFELDNDISFASPYNTSDTANNFYTPSTYDGASQTWYWRVTPYDSKGQNGQLSATFSYAGSGDQVAPDLIYPYYYYPPNTFPAPDEAVYMNPYVDRTVSWPIFYWHRLTTPAPTGGTYAYAYRIQVSTSLLFSPIIWTSDTQNTHAAPTAGNPFTPVSGQDYYWRVRPLNNSGGEIGDWSQPWKTRITLPTPAGTTNPPQLVRPVNAAEFVETTPLFEWKPVTGATSYEVQINDLVTTVNTDSVPYPVYSPSVSLAQRLLGKTNFGTYYWRVRAISGVVPGTWSEIRRFQIAAQSERIVGARTLGAAENKLLVATDPNDIADDNYELTNLYVTQDSSFWYFGFNATAAATDMSYALYLDVNHQDNSGGTSDPRGNAVTTIAAHRPEYVLYIDQISSSFSVTDTALNKWNGSGWNTPESLSAIGGGLLYDVGSGYVELRIPNTLIGMQDDTGSYAVSLLSLPAGTGQLPGDSVPSDPNVPGSSLVSRFTSVSERMNQVMPANNAAGDLVEANPFVLPFYWDYPTGATPTNPWTGARMRVYLDPGFTTEIANFNLTSTAAYYASTDHSWSSDLSGDNSYYWRIQPRYLPSNSVYGVWSQGGRFERRGFVPQNLQESVTFATPTFSWDMVEGAEKYQLYVSTDPLFGSRDIDKTTGQNSYTHTSTLPSGIYYWKVRVLRHGGVTNEWSVTRTFTLTFPTPTGLSPNDPNPDHAIHSTPNFCWQPLIATDQGVPILAAYKYKLQVSLGDPTFSSPLETVTTEQKCWTPKNGYDDGTYYWRVAMVDGNSNIGVYSPTAQFTKQYPYAIPLSPVNGSTITETPTFMWTAGDGVTPYVFGAANYKIEICQDQFYSLNCEKVTTPNTRYIPTKVYDIKKTYYWRVAIVDKNGNFGPWSNATLIINPFMYEVHLPFVKK
jgi:hypothetical protein